MPHKRKSRVISNQKNPVHRRMLHDFPGVTPNVCVQPDNGAEPESVLKSNEGQFDPPALHIAKPTTLAAPQYNTTVRKQSEINAINQMRALVTEANLTPRSKAAIAPKVTQKMNFPPDRTVFKNLLPLNVNDSILTPHKKPPTKSRTSKEGASNSTNTQKPTSNEPQLADYAERIERIVMSLPEPDLQLDFAQQPFDFLQSYRKVYY